MPTIHNYIMKEHTLKNYKVPINFTNMFKKPYAIRLISGISVNVGQQVSGINFFIFYSSQFWTFITNDDSNLYSLVISINNFVGVFIAVFIIIIYGRRNPILYGMFGQAIFIFLSLVSMYYKKFQFMYYIASGFVLSYSIGLGTCY